MNSPFLFVIFLGIRLIKSMSKIYINQTTSEGCMLPVCGLIGFLLEYLLWLDFKKHNLTLLLRNNLFNYCFYNLCGGWSIAVCRYVFPKLLSLWISFGVFHRLLYCR